MNHLSKQFHYILQCIRTLEPHHPKLLNPLVKQNIKAAYVGGDLCGEATLVGKTLLEQQGINNIKVIRNERGSGELYQDHCYIVIKDTIIDLTYKQFLQDERVTHPNCPYHQYIQYTLPPYFIGSHNDLMILLNQCISLNKKIYGKTDLEYNNKFWNIGQDITHRFNYKKCIQEKIIDINI